VDKTLYLQKYWNYTTFARECEQPFTDFKKDSHHVSLQQVQKRTAPKPRNTFANHHILEFMLIDGIISLYSFCMPLEVQMTDCNSLHNKGTG
jgi:hypothetical protein